MNKVLPGKKDPKQKAALSVPTVAARLRVKFKPAPKMVKVK